MAPPFSLWLPQCLPSSVQVGKLTLGQRGGAFSKNVLAFIARDTK